MSKPSLILLGRPYDRVSAILDGRVLFGGQPANCQVLNTVETFRRLMNDDNVLAGEMSLGFHVAALSSQERSRFLAIPVYPVRSFRHGNVFVRKNSPLVDFSQLKGARVGLEEYAMTMAIWIRRLFADAGIADEDIHWFTGRAPVVVPEVEEKLKKRIRIERARAPIFTLLEQGEIDVAIGRPPDFEQVTNGPFRRLLNDHWAHQREYYAKTRIFPAMHVLVVRRDVFEANPEVALDLYNAFLESKRLLIEDMRTNLNSGITTLPMLELYVNETLDVFGKDWWPYGIAQNRPMLEAFLSYCVTQEVISKPVTLEQIFCQNTLNL
jgi:4,5-dihydroxyphthalate decarboxylase